MGALLMTSLPDPIEARQERLHAMASRSPYRGALTIRHLAGFTVGIQARQPGRDASLVERPWGLVAVHARAYDERRDDWHLDGRTSAEVVADLWEELGQAAFAQLDGEYSLCLVDAGAGAAYCCVSLMMTKPLYVAQATAGLVLASDIRQCAAGAYIPQHLDPEQAALVHWFRGPIDDSTRTSYTRIDRLVSPNLYRCRPGGRSLTRTGTYWTAPPHDPTPVRVSEPRAAEPLLQAFSRSLAALPGRIGFLLSAGHDSGLLWAVLQRTQPRAGMPRLYSGAFRGDPYDEIPAVEAMLARVGQRTEIIDVSTALSSAFIDEHVHSLDRIPLAHTFRNTTVMARRLKADGTDYALSGLGAELTILASSLYMLDLLREGQWGAFASDLFRFRPFMLREQSLPRRVRFLLRRFLRAEGSLLHRRQELRRLRCVGDRWRRRCSDALRSRHWAPSREGSGYAGRPHPARASVLTDFDVMEQEFERHGIEHVMPFCYRSIIDIGWRIPQRQLSRGLGEKQALRDCARLALGEEPPWPTYKDLPVLWNRLEPRIITDLGDPASWRLVAEGILEATCAGSQYDEARRSSYVPNGWGRGAYVERYLRAYGA